MKLQRENAQQKNSDSHIYFVTQEKSRTGLVQPHLDTIMTICLLAPQKASYEGYIK